MLRATDRLHAQQGGVAGRHAPIDTPSLCPEKFLFSEKIYDATFLFAGRDFIFERRSENLPKIKYGLNIRTKSGKKGCGSCDASWRGYEATPHD